MLFWGSTPSRYVYSINEGSHDVLLKEIKDFLYVHLLYWLEVMSLIKEVQASSIALITAARCIEVSNYFIVI
jgi:hypothetical protein